jgi:hypothetical protein
MGMTEKPPPHRAGNYPCGWGVARVPRVGGVSPCRATARALGPSPRQLGGHSPEQTLPPLGVFQEPPEHDPQV